MADYELFRIVWAVALVLMLLPLALPLARSRRQTLQRGAIWVLIAGFVFAFYRIGEWALSG